MIDEVWECKDGRNIKVSKMTKQHILNVLKMILSEESEQYLKYILRIILKDRREQHEIIVENSVNIF